MTGTDVDRIKRLKMRSMRRGIKEMDIILGAFADMNLADLTEGDLRLYEVLLTENDHDIYQWVSGQRTTPPPYLTLVTRIAENQQKRQSAFPRSD